MTYTQLNTRFRHRVTALVTHIDSMDPVQLALGSVVLFLCAFAVVFPLALLALLAVH